MIVIEMCHSLYPKVLLLLVVEERDVCSYLIPVEEVYPELLNLLDDDDR